MGQRRLKLFDAREGNRDLGVNERIDNQIGVLGRGFQGGRRPPGPGAILGCDVQQNVAVPQDWLHDLWVPRVRAMIWSVVILMVARPRRLATAALPRVRPRRWVLTRRTVWPSTTKSTSVSGSRPNFSRTVCGMVT